MRAWPKEANDEEALQRGQHRHEQNREQELDHAREHDRDRPAISAPVGGVA
jgi:hypothetical protein